MKNEILVVGLEGLAAKTSLMRSWIEIGVEGSSR